MAFERFSSPDKKNDNENEEEKNSQADLSDQIETGSESADENNKGVGKRQKSYRFSEEVSQHTSKPSDSMDPKTLAELKKLKKAEPEDQPDSSDTGNQQAA
jgi:predicted glycosyltransferase